MTRVSVYSYSIKYRRKFPFGPPFFNFVFDCRGVPNPGRIAELKDKTGLDMEVTDFLDRDLRAQRFLGDVSELLHSTLRTFIEKEYKTCRVGFCCTGGRHRSVYFAERIASSVRELLRPDALCLYHLDIDSNYTCADKPVDRMG
ncbi:RapZ C-terminal domain-containing protein [Lentisalinibacter orientalis]|uniref:RapZ C-terminal domain-containing protein n=1 Tax=Lentisalinibacter orientalis TaxID=2992241 RepID=UPI003864D051